MAEANSPKPRATRSDANDFCTMTTPEWTAEILLQAIFGQYCYVGDGRLHGTAQPFSLAAMTIA